MPIPAPDDLLAHPFGLPSFRPGQREVIDALLAHRAALAVFPTGGGKSLCYQLPALLFPGVTVVVSPLIALMKDQIDFLLERGIAAARLDSSLGPEALREVEGRLREGELKLLYVAPERFNNERFLDLLTRTPISLFAVDEAHCISEWGHNFRPDYLKLAETARRLGAERLLALTATATPKVVRDICASFEIPREAAIVTGFHRANLFLRTSPTAPAERDRALLDRLSARTPGSGIVYVTLQRTAEQLAAFLAAAGVPARAYHAGMPDEERVDVQEWWKGSDRGTVVATIAFGMGIDKADVRYVYHYNLPKSLESYSQEVGRAGRDGLPSEVELLGGLDDLATLENFAYGDTPTAESLRTLLEDVLSRGSDFQLDLYSLSFEHDIRQLVLRTVLTYLELLGVLRQGTPYYSTYRVRLRLPVPEIVSRFSGERATFLGDLFAASKQGREWYTIDPAQVAVQLGEERDRVVKALGYLADQGWAELKPADVRQRYTRLPAEPDIAGLLVELRERFERREAQEIDRLGLVARWVRHAGCLTNALCAYFGERRDEPCGHCSYCETGRATDFPPVPAIGPIDTALDRTDLETLVEANSRALGEPRQRARFLCGLSSPALTRAKLTKNPLFGRLQDRRFPEVLAWCGG